MYFFFLFIREQDKRTQRDLAWKKIEEKAALKAKELGLTTKYEEIICKNFDFERTEKIEFLT